MSHLDTLSTRPIHRPDWMQGALLLTLFALVNVLGNDDGRAQSSPITPSGLGTQVDSSYTAPAGKTQYDITGGTRVGTNLFHSFGNFNVPDNQIANFLNDTNQPTSNILGRVTGGNGSAIFGTIQTTGFGNANLFLMNPAGIVVGPHASLHVGGAVAFTTADYLRLAIPDDASGFFYANPTAPSLLTSAPVAAYGFLGTHHGVISVQGSHLQAPAITLVGKSITVGASTLEHQTVRPAQLSAPNGIIQLAGAASAGEFDATTLQSIPNMEGALFTSYSSAQFAPGSSIDTRGSSAILIQGGRFVLNLQGATFHTGEGQVTPNTMVFGTGSELVAATSSADPGPTLQLRSEKSILLRENSAIASRTMGTGQSGLVRLTAPVVSLEGRANITTSTAGPGSAGSVEINGNQITLIDRSAVMTSTSSAGHGGNITIQGLAGQGHRAHDIHLSQTSLFASETVGDGVTMQGPSGNIRIETDRLDMSGASQLTTSSRGSRGHAGNISINANTSVHVSGIGTQIASNSSEFSSGGAGPVSITAPSVLIEKSGRISSSTGLTGNAGSIMITTDNLHLLSAGHITSGSLAEFLDFPPSGVAGTVSIQRLTGSASSILIEGANSGIFTNTQGTGIGGLITLETNTITIKNGGTVSTQTTGTTHTATGGSIHIQATDHISLSNHASITASGRGTTAGDAGNITLNAGQYLELRDHSSITTSSESAQANGGNIDIRAIDHVRLVTSNISTSVNGAEGSGGNIFIDPKIIILQSSNVIAQAVGGAGGNITFVTPLFLADQSSLIDASSQFGLNGTVTIQSPIANLSGTVAQLASQPSPVQLLFQSRCATLANTQQGSLTLSRRQTISTPPGDWMSSPFMVASEYEPSNTSFVSLENETKELDALSVSSMNLGNTGMLSLRQLTPPGFLVHAFAGQESRGCRL